MCGFVGFVDAAITGNALYPPRDTLASMAQTIAHRGPDGEGYYVDEESGAGLGFKRLAIIDVAGGDQPLLNEDGTVVLCFNGEIYNHHELRRQLEALGHRFTTQSDSEVVLHGYEQWGDSLLPKLRGMFAFVVWDSKAKRLFAARDAFGIKPLYYQPLGQSAFAPDGTAAGILFASEIKGMLPHPAFHKACNTKRLGHYLCMEYLPDEETLFEGVYKLPAGHFLVWQGGLLYTTRWFSPTFAPIPHLALGEAAEAISQEVSDSVEAHLAADVEVGGFLSGGVDSSLIAFEANKHTALSTFSVGWAQQRYSELTDAERFAQATNIQNTGRLISADEFFQAVPAVQYAMDEPLPNPSAIPLWFLAHFAAEHVKVVLSGEGADELFGGYPLYQEALTYEPYMRVPAPVRRVLGATAKTMPAFHGRRFLTRGANALPQRFARGEYVFSHADLATLVNPEVFASLQQNSPYSLCAPLFNDMQSQDEATQMQLIDLHTWLPNDILLKADKMSMAASLELRVPFLDKDVWRVVRTLPPELRVTKTQTKPALRTVAESILPDRTAYMPKKGFLTPLNEWLKQEPWTSMVREVFASKTAAAFFRPHTLMQLLDDHISGRTHNMRKIWSIYCFLIWFDAYFGIP